MAFSLPPFLQHGRLTIVVVYFDGLPVLTGRGLRGTPDEPVFAPVARTAPAEPVLAPAMRSTIEEPSSIFSRRTPAEPLLMFGTLIISFLRGFF